MAAFGQGPTIGTIDFYGLRKVPEAKIRAVLGFAEGGRLPGSKGDIEERIAGIPGIVDAHVEAACCDEDGHAILYIGVEEKGSPHFDLRTIPESEISLPDSIIETYRRFLSTAADAARRGVTAEDLTQGHSLMADAETREVQLRFADLASKNVEVLRQVLRTSGHDEERAIAAYVIGYAPKKREVVDDLQYALKDPDDTVRANALRALAAITVYATLNPESGIKIAPTWFIEMLNSVSWTDRNNAAVALVNLTETRDPSALEQLKERALPALQDMARFKHLAHALPAFILLGRVQGMAEKDIQDAWANNRDRVLAPPSKKK